MPAWKWSGRYARAIPARPRWCCSASCSPGRGARAMPSGRIGRWRRTPRSARWRSTAARASSCGSAIPAPAKPSPGLPSRIPPTPRHRPRSTSSATCSPTGATGWAPRSGSPSWSRATPPPAVAAWLGRLDTLELAGLDSAAEAEVRMMLGRSPQQDVDALLAWSEGLAVRGFGPAAVRLGWQAALKAPADPRVLRAIFPWPNRQAVEAEAAEFGVDPLLFVAIVRQESVFDAEALSPAGARGRGGRAPRGLPGGGGRGRRGRSGGGREGGARGARRRPTAVGGCGQAGTGGPRRGPPRRGRGGGGDAASKRGKIQVRKDGLLV